MQPGGYSLHQPQSVSEPERCDIYQPRNPKSNAGYYRSPLPCRLGVAAGCGTSQNGILQHAGFDTKHRVGNTATDKPDRLAGGRHTLGAARQTDSAATHTPVYAQAKP